MTEPIAVKRGDVGIIFTDTLTADGEPIILSDCEVWFVLRPQRGDLLNEVTAEADVVDANEGTVRYVTVVGDLDVAGFYRQEWEVVYTNGDRFTVPSDGYNVVHVVMDLNPEDDGS